MQHFESEEIQISGLIISDYSKQYSHWKSEESLDDWMKKSNIPGIYGIDTRKLTKELREFGTMKGRIVYEECKEESIIFDTTNLIQKVSNPIVREFNKNGTYKIIIIDCDIKNNIIRKLLEFKDIYLKK